jgi:hypothetical protein
MANLGKNAFSDFSLDNNSGLFYSILPNGKVGRVSDRKQLRKYSILFPILKSPAESITSNAQSVVLF